MAVEGAVFTKMEFAVQMSCTSCEEAVKGALNLPGIRSVFVDVANELVLVETSLPSSTVQQCLEETGKLVVFRGYGGTGAGTPSPSHHGAAVAIMKRRGQVHGLARLVQVSQEQCVIEGTVDGLAPGVRHSLAVHEYGDLSGGCESCGRVYGGSTSDPSSQPPGQLGTMDADEKGRASFQLVSENIKVWDIIGRGMVVHSSADVSSSRVMCAVIARSAGLFQNTKKVCTCDGVTIWDEARRSAQEKKDNT